MSGVLSAKPYKIPYTSDPFDPGPNKDPKKIISFLVFISNVSGIKAHLHGYCDHSPNSQDEHFNLNLDIYKKALQQIYPIIGMGLY